MRGIQTFGILCCAALMGVVSCGDPESNTYARRVESVGELIGGPGPSVKWAITSLVIKRFALCCKTKVGHGALVSLAAELSTRISLGPAPR